MHIEWGCEWWRDAILAQCTFLFLAHTMWTGWVGRITVQTVTQGLWLMLSPLSHSCTIWPFSQLETVTAATICFGLECHMSLPLNSLLVRTSHLILKRVGMYNLPMGLKGEENQMCLHSLIFTKMTPFFFPTKKITKGLSCCLIPSNLETEKKICFWQNPIYTRPRVLFVTN